MKIAVVGGGFTGLTAAYELSKKGHAVTLFEKEKTLGGLAYGFKEPRWQWHLEYAYHHWFTNDDAVIRLIRELGLKKKLIIKRPKTATYLPSGHIAQLDSPQSLLTFSALPLSDRLRTGFLLGLLKLNPFWKPLEHITASSLFRTIGGEAAWKTLWEPLMVGKFGDYADRVQAAWLWARIKKRTPSLGYMEGGFHTLVEALERAIKKNGGTIQTGTSAWEFSKLQRKFDNILLTVPTPIATRIAPLPKKYIQKLTTIPHLFAQTLILETQKPVLRDTYWLNITDRSFPFLAVVAHTNFVDKKYYAHRHITYIGNYLPQHHPLLSMSEKQLMKKFLPFIKKLNPAFKGLGASDKLHAFVGPFAQPVHLGNYSSHIPSIKTPLPGVFLANMDFIVPWDRGTNYAVELGERAAASILA